MKRHEAFKVYYKFDYQNYPDLARSKLMYQGLMELEAGNSEQGDVLIQDAIDRVGCLTEREYDQIWNYVHKKAKELRGELDGYRDNYIQNKKFFEEDPMGMQIAKERGWVTEAEAEEAYNARINDVGSFYNYMKSKRAGVDRKLGR